MYSEKVTVREDATTVTEEDLNIPEGYTFASAYNINSQNKVRVNLDKIVTYKNVTVKYFCDGKLLEGKDQIVIAEEDATRISEDKLEIPEGYEFVSAKNINSKNVVRVDIRVKTKPVTVLYFYNDNKILTEKVNVPEAATTVTAEDLNIPEGYEFASAYNINSQNKVRVNLNKIVTYKDVTVMYFCENAKILEETVKVREDATTVTKDQLNIPEGYEFVSAYNISTQNKVRVNLNKIVTYKNVTVKYFCNGKLLEGKDQIVIAEEDATRISEEKLEIPEGYTFVSAKNINSKNVVRVDLKENVKTKSVKVLYFCGKTKVSEEQVDVPEDATRVSEDQLNIPKGYEYVSAKNISRRNTVKVELKMAVKANDNSTVSVYSEKEDDTQVTPAEVTPVEENTGILGFLRTFIRGLR